jgi:outer membrane protein assembly factor BamB
VNTEERQLSDLLHRLTPEPPRRVTVEDVAFRMSSQAGRGPGRHHEPRRSFGGRGLVPALAAVAVFVVAGLSAGVVSLVSHHTSTPPVASGGVPTTSTSAPASAVVSSSAPATSGPVSSGAATQPSAIAGGPFGAVLIDHQTFTQDSLVAGDGALYAIAPGSLDRIDPATGIVSDVSVASPAPGPPVVDGHTVWVVSYQPGGVIDLHGYDASTLAQVASYQVTALGTVSSTPEGALAAGPDGTLFVAAGVTVAAVDPSTGQVIQRYFLNSAPASTVAVSPDGSTLYVGSGSFRVVKFAVNGAQRVGDSTMNIGGAGGNLVATPGGLWGTVGIGMSEWVWYAPNGNLSRAARVSQGAGAGLASVPAYSGGHVWIGGGQSLACADPSTGQVLTSANLPTDNGALEYFSSVAVVGGQAYAYYEDQPAQRSGIVRMTLPAACAS